MGRSPIKIEIINDAAEIDFNDCYKKREVIHIDGINISLISFKDLLKNKRAAGRPQDIADVKKLERYYKKKSSQD